jgi:hypothetical protein
MPDRIRLNRPELRDFLKGKQVEDYLSRRMERVLESARGDNHDDTYAYQNSLRIESVQHPSRVVVRVVADVDYAMALEAKYGILSRALDAAGGR